MEISSIRLCVCGKDYIRFSKTQKEIFTEENENNYYVELPMERQTESANMEAPSIEEYVIACCETALILPDPKYELMEEAELNCQIMKVTSNEKIFSILVTIQYPNNQDLFHDILFFREVSRSETQYIFEFSGDQTLFAL